VPPETDPNGDGPAVKHNLAEKRMDYTGAELRSHFIRDTFGIEGDCIAAFRGACRVSGERLVDLEDFRAGATVRGDDMMHFIVEIFGISLPHITAVQRLLCAAAKDVVDSKAGRLTVVRRGDDLYVGEGKLSVSVATVSPVSGLIHLGLNITAEGVPVRAACLLDLGLDPEEVASQLMKKFVEEVSSVEGAARKVRPVE
jgi:hypothetical protein